MDRTDLLRKDKSPASGNQEHDPVEMLDSIASFLRRFLVCDELEITILTLWIAHTYCQSQFLTTAYLDIRSPESQSGKSLCLALLNSLCYRPVLLTGASATTVKDRLLHSRSVQDMTNKDGKIVLKPPHAILLDNCHHILSSSERQPLLAILTAGTRSISRYAWGNTDYCVFGPKAFAGNGRLPRSLAELCIPIVLRRKKPSEKIPRFDHDTDRLPDKVLNWLCNLMLNSYLASEDTLQAPPNLPPDLTPRQQDCAEPLLHLADSVAGPWPAKARAAIAAAFKLSEWTDSIQVLWDIRAWFHVKDNPEHLLSRDLLALLTAMEQRPWSGWTGKSGRKLGRLLNPYGIFSRNMTIGDKKNLKGYLLKDFSDAWERYLPSLPLETLSPEKKEA